MSEPCPNSQHSRRQRALFPPSGKYNLVQQVYCPITLCWHLTCAKGEEAADEKTTIHFDVASGRRGSGSLAIDMFRHVGS